MPGLHHNMNHLTEGGFNPPEDPKTPHCCSCGTTKELEWGPDPFDHDIHGNETPVWECKDCRYESCQDI